jgi:hypothetical protein
MESGAILSRVAQSWVRFGTFELLWYRGEKVSLRKIVDYLIQNYFQRVISVGPGGPPRLSRRQTIRLSEVTILSDLRDSLRASQTAPAAIDYSGDENPFAKLMKERNTSFLNSIQDEWSEKLESRATSIHDLMREQSKSRPEINEEGYIAAHIANAEVGAAPIDVRPDSQ